eukprot:TRINITY_DN2853_c0_g3_i4.p1 TRINITY_DN2853_c0_g3~~TRINITY_DN2853_c0_g3_i4.p1  ORF type:complete len:475 (-),score=49.79 TRINITY_DN2853_c0_g3_i4:231-1586(-)
MFEEFDLSNVLRDPRESTDGGNLRPEALANSEDFSASFFRCLMTEDVKQRKQALDQIISLLAESFYTSDCQLIRSHLPRVLFLAHECPILDIRQRFSNFLESYSEEISDPSRHLFLPTVSPPSIFFPPEVIPPIDSEDPEVKKIFMSAFLQTGRVSHLTRLLAWHPECYPKFNETIQYIMYGSGPLPLSLRFYLAIMAVSRWENVYLLRQLQREFLLQGGEDAWLSGIHNAPNKVQDLLHLNAVLAHHPWSISRDDIAKLVTGPDPWPLSEIVQTIVIFATYRGLACFVAAMGITVETDLITTTTMSPGHLTPPPSAPLTPVDESFGASSEFEKNLKNKLRSRTSVRVTHVTEINENFAKFLATEPSEIVTPPGSGAVTTGTHGVPWLENFNKHPSMSYRNFDIRSDRCLHVQDYSWSLHGYCHLCHYYSIEVASLLEDCITCIKNLTYES